MTELKFIKKKYKSADFGEKNAFPAMKNTGKDKCEVFVDEDDGLFIDYGSVRNILPYQMQDNYDRSENEKDYDIAVLENDYLKATFIINLGGKLWSLYDKKNKKDLITENPVIRPCNLALRNAWTAGGVEWNIGMKGHTPFTCSPLFTCRLYAEDKTPVLRMYEFERVRSVTYQMDFFLPEDSRFLYAAIRIVNPWDKVVPMYWWSNIAVPEEDGSRVIVPAASSFNADYDSEMRGKSIRKISVPDENKSFDMTYPTKNSVSIDYFFNIPQNERKFETQLDKNGYGLMHTSTARLQGRKLFVWGQGQGGRHWQEFLTDENGRPYQEMQGGIAKTQFECMPMPPHTAWEWLEAYGAINAEPEKVHGDWGTAVNTVKDRLEEILPEKKTEEILKTAKKDFILKKGELIYKGSGWGALENIRRKHSGLKSLSEHLDFGNIDCPQSPWLNLLEKGTLPDDSAPASYMIQDEWFSLLSLAVENKDRENPSALLHLGICFYAREDYKKAEECFIKSLGIRKSVYALYCLAYTEKELCNKEKAAEYIYNAAMMKLSDSSLIREALSLLSLYKKYDEMLEITENADEKIFTGRIKFYHAEAIAHKGYYDKALKILTENGGLTVPDIKEGETFTSDLYIYIMKKKAEKEGKRLETEDISVPYVLDFRMNVPEK